MTNSYSLAEIEAMLPHILKRKNIAHYKDGQVYIGNRSQYPFEKSFVKCDSVEEVAVAIETMVTQGVGPWVAAVHALAMHADLNAHNADIIAELEKAKTRLIQTRPTNTLIGYRLAEVLGHAKMAIGNGDDPAQAILGRSNAIMDEMYTLYARRAHFGAKLLADGDGVLTMCFAETSFILTCAFAKAQGKNIRVYVPETRPFLQGAKLTAPSLHEINIDVQLITDGMPSVMMAEGKIQKYMTAADLITLDGHVVNKVGTFHNAISAAHHGVPYYAFAWGCDPNKPDRASIDIEYRNPKEIKQCMGHPTSLDEIGAIYPAFDITPPELVAGIITRHGVLSPHELKDGFEQ